MEPCNHHKKIELGYIAWHNWATKMNSQKITQIRCKACKLYLFPNEINEPDNPKVKKVIENHNKYLELHPKAISLLRVGGI
jgi:hypothetical protein